MDTTQNTWQVGVHKPAFAKEVHTLGAGVKIFLFRYEKIISYSFLANKKIIQERNKGWLQSRTPGLNTQVTWPHGPWLSLVWGCSWHTGKAVQARVTGRDWSHGRGHQDGEHRLHTSYPPHLVSHVFTFSKDVDIIKIKHEFTEEISMEHLNSFTTPVQFNLVIMNTRELTSNLQEKGVKQVSRPESLVRFQRRSAPVSEAVPPQIRKYPEVLKLSSLFHLLSPSALSPPPFRVRTYVCSMYVRTYVPTNSTTAPYFFLSFFLA